MLKKNELMKILDSKKIEYQKHEHGALYSVQDSQFNRKASFGAHTKNLFLKNKKGYFCMFSCEEKSLIDLKKFSKSIEMGNLSFAKEEYMLKYLGIKPGSVSPFALLNDIDHKVNFYLEETLYNEKEINFHPLINTSTITMKTNEFIEFMIENNKKINIFSIKEYKIIKIL